MIKSVKYIMSVKENRDSTLLNYICLKLETAVICG